MSIFTRGRLSWPAQSAMRGTGKDGTAHEPSPLVKVFMRTAAWCPQIANVMGRFSTGPKLAIMPPGLSPGSPRLMGAESWQADNRAPTRARLFCWWLLQGTATLASARFIEWPAKRRDVSKRTALISAYLCQGASYTEAGLVG